MAPGTRRANRSGHVEHDDFEGLPIRQWRQEWVNVQPPAPAETTQKNDIWDVELPWGMPKDAGLLPQHSQDLLRAARSGVLYKRPAPTEEEEADADAVADKPEKKDDDASTKGFQIKVWKQISRNSEGSSVSHLAKRRKGTVTISSKTVASVPTTGATVTRATVRRVDAAGNPYTQEITLQDGQQIEGEIISTTVVPVAAIDPAQAPPQRVRRPPPPKKKNKPGPGRGRKKKTLPLPAPAAPSGGTPPVGIGAEVGTGVAPVVPNGTTEAAAATKLEREESINPDSEMADNDDDEGDDGEEGDDGDESQREGENPDAQDQEMTDASPAVPTPTVDTSAEFTDSESPVPKRAAPPPNPANLVPLHPTMHLAGSSPKGSPLKNVVLPSPAEPSPQMSPIADVLAPKSEPQQTDVAMADGPEPAAPEAPAAESPTQAQDAIAPELLPLDTTVSETVHETFIPPAEKVGDIVSPMAETRSTFSMATTAETDASGARTEIAEPTVPELLQDSMVLDVPEIPEALEAGEATEATEAPEASEVPEAPEPPSTLEPPPDAEEPPTIVAKDDSAMNLDSAPALSTTAEEPSSAPTAEAEPTAPATEDVPSAPATPAETEQQPVEPLKSPPKSPPKSPEQPPTPAEPATTAIEAPAEQLTEDPAEPQTEPQVDVTVDVTVDASVEPPLEAPVETPLAPPPPPPEPTTSAPAEAEPIAEAQVATTEPEIPPPATAEVPIVPKNEDDNNSIDKMDEDEGPDLLAGLETELDRQAELSKSPLPEPPAAPHPGPAELPELANPVPLPEVPPIEPAEPAEAEEKPAPPEAEKPDEVEEPVSTEEPAAAAEMEVDEKEVPSETVAVDVPNLSGDATDDPAPMSTEQQPPTNASAEAEAEAEVVAAAAAAAPPTTEESGEKGETSAADASVAAAAAAAAATTTDAADA